MPPLPTTRAKPSPGRESPTISLELTTLNLFVELLQFEVKSGPTCDFLALVSSALVK